MDDQERPTIPPTVEIIPRTGRGTEAASEARRIADDAGLRRASDAMMRIYEWPTTPMDGELDAEYGAPTSGGPPYRVYEITPRRVFGFPTHDSFAPTRYTFSSGR